MAYVDPPGGEKLVFQFGDGGSPEVFAAVCSINTDRSVDFSADVYTSQLADCATPSNPATTRRRVKSIDVKFTGAGMTDPASFQTLMQLFLAGQAFNGRLVQDVTGGWTLAGEWVIESLKTGGARGEDQAFDIAVSQAGALSVTYS